MFDPVIDYEHMKLFYKFYCTPGHNDRTSFVQRAIMTFLVNEREAILIWESFDIFSDMMSPSE